METTPMMLQPARHDTVGLSMLPAEYHQGRLILASWCTRWEGCGCSPPKKVRELGMVMARPPVSRPHCHPWHVPRQRASVSCVPNVKAP